MSTAAGEAPARRFFGIKMIAHADNEREAIHELWLKVNAAGYCIGESELRDMVESVASAMRDFGKTVAERIQELSETLGEAVEPDIEDEPCRDDGGLPTPDRSLTNELRSRAKSLESVGRYPTGFK